jgi:hypothetical protein
MGKHWVRARTNLSRHDMSGAYRTFHPGDWFECRNQELRDLLEKGHIDTTAAVIRAEFAFEDAAVLVLAGNAPLGLEEYGIRVAHGDRLALPAERVLLWTGATLTAEAVALGLSRLEATPDTLAWEMAAMLKGDRLLARDVGTQIERDKTLDLVGTLELPVYDTRAVWVRDTDATREVIQLWQDELDAGADPTHAFLRSIYTRRVLLCTLPANWIGASWRPA